MKEDDIMQQSALLQTRPQDAYKRQDILTANSIDLVVMLYDALKKNLILGKRKIAKNDIERAHNHLMKAQEIVSALINSLDMNYEISEDLFAIYEFILSSAEEANRKKDAAPIEPLIEIVEELRSAWDEIRMSVKGSMYMSEEQA